MLALDRYRRLNPSGDLPTTDPHYFMVTSRAQEAFTVSPGGAWVPAQRDADIANAIRGAAPGAAGGAMAQWGNWVGPKPRVTRARDWGLFNQPNITRVAWLYQVPAGTFFDQHGDYILQQLANGVTAGLHALDSSFEPAVVTPVTPDATTVQWWNSGQAASQATFINTIPLLPTTAADNPTAPGMLGVGGEGIEGLLPSPSTIDKVIHAAKVIAIVGVAAVAAAELGPPLLAWGVRTYEKA